MSEEVKKPCKKCGIPKPLSDFPPSKHCRDGRENTCKKCRSEIAAEWNRNHSKRRSLIRKRYKDSENGREVISTWNQTHRERLREKAKVWSRSNALKVLRSHQKARSEFPERVKARGAVNTAVRLGKLPHVKSLHCIRCGDPAREYHHHKGYAPEHWLDVVPACHRCHHILEPAEQERYDGNGKANEEIEGRVIEEIKKPCSECRVPKPLSAFPKRGARCKQCKNTRNRAWGKRYRRAFPEKEKAHKAVQRAVADKILPPVKSLKCIYCPDQAREYHHHNGYSQLAWLDVVPVCRNCHVVISRGH